jgi:threonine dehydratase
MLVLSDIYAAQRRIAPYIHQTPVLTSQLLDQKLGRRLFLKAEHLQKTGSFKARGALNAALQLENPTGIIAVSSGNHAQGVAYAAQVLGVPALVVMPAGASNLKKEATRSYGATVYDKGVTFENREEVLAGLVEETGYSLIHPFNDYRVMAGQGTVALELLQQVPQLDAVLVAIGGGGLMAGVATAIKAMTPWIEVIGVEPATANDAQQSLAAGRRIKLPHAPDTVADGVRTLMVGERNFPILQQHVDRVITASEAAILEAQALMMTRTKQLIEPTGALPLAPLLEGAQLPTHLGIVVCGGNWWPGE